MLPFCALLPAQAPPLEQVAPQEEGFSSANLERIQVAVSAALRAGQAPGCVVLVGRHGRVVYRRAFGARSLAPAFEPMTPDAVFDMASLTKPLATATSILILARQGRLKLSDPVVRHLPGFTGKGKKRITIEQLLRHRGGLLPDNALADYREGPSLARRRIFDLDLRAAPGERFIYTDVGFIVLGWVVEAVSGMTLDAFARKNVFAPLGMHSTRFRPTRSPPPWLPARRIVPTEPASKGQPPLRGAVHDPRARLLGGVAGHAGLFSCADDVARFASMLLSGGKSVDGARILAEETVRAMTSAGDLPAGERRGLGWDLGTRFSGPRGRHLPEQSFGHTGFTGTSLWMDPATGTFLIILTSRLHPDGRGDVRPLRAALADIVAEALRDAPWPLQLEPRKEPVLPALERVARGLPWPARLRGRPTALITNHTGLTLGGRRGIDVLQARRDIPLVALFSPEHGIRGALDGKVSSSRDAVTGLVVHSLYGETRRPTAAMLEGVEVLVFDIQDIGTRFYTYVSTLVYAMEEAAQRGIAVVVLDRPNPIGGERVAGPVADARSLDFVGCLRIPVRHGMTVGELARLAVRERGLRLDLEVIPVRGWRRGVLQDATGIPWIDPSPNMRSLDEALLYPGVGLLETTNLSVGRGTERPFELVGAPWLDAPALVRRLRSEGHPGVMFSATHFRPASSVYADASCAGVRFRVTDRRALRPLRLGMALATALCALHPREWKTERYDRLLKHRATLQALLRGAGADSLCAAWTADLQDFLARRRPHLLYDR